MVEMMEEVVLTGDFLLLQRRGRGRGRWLLGSFMDFVGLLLRDLDTIFSLFQK
jgi:hypothetical protein